MKVALKAGAEVDFLSPPEYKAEMDRLRQEIRRQAAPNLLEFSVSFAADAAGVVGGGLGGPGAVLFTAPVGISAKIHRVQITGAGVTPIAPLAVGWLALYRTNPSLSTLLEFTPALGSVNTLPWVVTRGQHDAPLLRSGERLVVAGAAITAGLQMGCQLHVQQMDDSTTGDWHG